MGFPCGDDASSSRDHIPEEAGNRRSDGTNPKNQQGTQNQERKAAKKIGPPSHEPCFFRVNDETSENEVNTRDGGSQAEPEHIGASALEFRPCNVGKSLNSKEAEDNAAREE